MSTLDQLSARVEALVNVAQKLRFERDEFHNKVLFWRGLAIVFAVLLAVQSFNAWWEAAK